MGRKIPFMLSLVGMLIGQIVAFSFHGLQYKILGLAIMGVCHLKFSLIFVYLFEIIPEQWKIFSCTLMSAAE